MLRPVDTATRERRSLDGLWRFALDAGGTGRDERWWTKDLPGTSEMPVPASYNDVLPEPDLRAYVGEVWYQTTVRVPRGWDVGSAISVLGPEVIEDLRVEARNGVVTLAGTADRRSTRKLARRIAARTPGVLRVVDDMTHDIHDRAPRVPAASDVLAPAAA